MQSSHCGYGGERSLTNVSPKLLNNISINKSHNKERKEHEENSDEWSQNSYIKLQHILQYIKRLKDQRRAHNLVMNLPSRMLRSFDKNKFDLLNDKAFHYDEQTYLQLINQHNINNNNLQNNSSLTQEPKNQDKNRQSQSLTSSIFRYNNNYFEQDSVVDDKNNQQTNSIRKQIHQKQVQYFKNIFITITSYIFKILEQIPVILPSSPLKFIWDLIFMILLIICLFYLPITISFGFIFSDLISQSYLITIPTLILLNTFFQINTGYYKKGQVIISRFKIIKKYVKKTLIQDFICVFPLTFTLYHQANKYQQQQQQDIDENNSYYQLLLLPFIFKVFSINATLKNFEERFNLPKFLLNMIQLTKLLFTIIFINHLFACLWLYIARIERKYGVDQVWVSYDNVQNANWTRQYVAGFYFMTLTMITVGYGDFLPKNQQEQILSVITMMISCGVFAYTLNEVGSIFNNFFQVDREIKRKQILIQKFMSTKNINKKLQYQIREYLEYCWREQAETDYEEKQMIIDQLSDSLRQKLLFEANKIVLRDNPTFKQNFSKSVIEKTVPLILEMKYSPESIIFQKGELDDCSIYFIEKGSIEVVLNPKGNNQAQLLKLSKGESFGSHCFFTGLPRINTVRSCEFTTVLKIRRQDFLQLLSCYPEDYETFCFIRDQINFLNDYSKIGYACKSCSSSYHLVNDCQYLHYIANKAKVIKMYNDENNIKQTERVPYQRRNPNINYHYKNSLTIQNDVFKQNLIFLEQNESLLNFSEDDNEFSDGYFSQESLRGQQNMQSYAHTDGANFKKNIFLISEQSTLKEQENDSNFKYPLTKKNTISKFGQDYNHIVSKSLNTIDKNLDSALENIALQNDDLSLNIPDITLQQQNIQMHTSYLDQDVTSKKNVITSPSKKNFDIQFNTINRMRTNTADRSEFNFDQNTSFNQAYQSFSSEVNSRQVLQTKLQANEDALAKKSKSISLQKQKSQKNHSQISLIEFDKALSLENKLKKNLTEQISSVLKQIQILVSQNQQNQINEKKKAQQIENDIGQFDIFLNFDKMRQFIKYNPRYNFSSVISRFNQFQDLKNKRIRTKKSVRIKRLTTQALIKTQQNTQLDSKKLQKNASSNKQFTNNFYEYSESKLDSKKVHTHSVKQESNLDPTSQDIENLKLKNILIANNYCSDSKLQLESIDQAISQIIEGINKKSQLNAFSIYPSKNELNLDSNNNSDIMSESSFQSKFGIKKFQQQQIGLFERLKKDY
ncbi:cation channel family protein (macronuclear) [Tetrahymena thermophila SB210]|uniref:Cation channel family protein n=1 Tax=Tetrahymena thermophila (strain SB210) TaxID=312017 RepID=Q23AA6_TETTS|nr:cation channel family protein [Tetrahymena thermophila SB210]EAR93586.2 cation channel family protein [Tetrahymena thermophila SB210]|eukprot:XP_001013831.2 cation channel family protein [Tetrahymena thermophila SB210]